MKILIDQNNYIDFPDSGQKNWAPPLAKTFQSMANYLRRRLANVVHASDKNHFLDDNTFLKIPRVQTINEANQDIDSGDFDLLRSKDIKDVQGKIIQNTENINNSFSIMGMKSSEKFLEDLQEDLLTSTDLGDAWATVSQFIDAGKTRMTIQEAFAVMAKSINSLSPLGEIKPFWGMAPKPLARWQAVDNANEAGAVNIGDNFLQKGHLLGKTPGFYRLAGGNWALCDGSFPLPPHLHGSGNNYVSAWIPDLRETYLEGAGELQKGVYTQDDIEAKVAEEKAYLQVIIDTMEDGAEKTKLIEELGKIDYLSFSDLLNQPKFIGKNTFKLLANQLPQHKHAMEHIHGGVTVEEGAHKHTLWLDTGSGGTGSAREILKRYTALPNTLSNEMFKDKNGEHLHNFKTRGSLDINSPVIGVDKDGDNDPVEDPKTETDAIGNHDDIDKRPQRLQVAYYMRVR